jgi:hypothetical protein
MLAAARNCRTHTVVEISCVVQALKSTLRIMRYKLTDHQWAAIKPMLPNKPRDVSLRGRSP